MHHFHKGRVPSSACARKTLLLLAVSLVGCAAMTQDVHQYYRQMATNFKEAEEKAKVRIATRQREASMLLKGGEVHQYKRAIREVNRLKNWQEHCARERERFEKAAEKLEPAGQEQGVQAQRDQTASSAG
ncbi:MAG: hypothetical protein M1335_04290 [Chloroflexi bacterium]|nr:hypothetical protein [Chloroflexota bacterium]